jgi:processive 1,2-diacylglycerol beta-glucosyltransferase
VQTQVVDSYKYAALVVSRVVSEGYLQMVKTIPQMYRYIYRRAERATEVGPFRTWAHQFTAGNLRPLMEKERPDIVVCTHAFPCGAMAEYKKLYDDAPPVVGIVTDFAVHAFWMHANVDGYAVATDAMRDIMVARGIEPARIRVTGIPVDPRFAPNSEPRERVRERLGLPADRAVVLMMGGGLGLGPIVKMLRALDGVEVPVCAVVIAGRNAKLETRVLAAANDLGYPLRVLRFVSNIHDYMHASDLLLTKPGGLTTAEALVAGVPMVLFKPLPGQEERNVRYLTEQHTALRARTADELERSVHDLLLVPDRRERMTAASRSVAKPEAARDAARLIEELATRREAYA